MRIPLAIALAQALLLAAAARAVDWEHRVVRCSGSGAANLKDADGNPAVARIGAEKAARLDALRNCLATLRGMQLESGRTVGNALESDASLSGRVQGLVRGFRTVGNRMGDRPLVVKAVRVEGPDLVISAADAAQVASPVPAFLAQGKVVILAD